MQRTTRVCRGVKGHILCSTPSPAIMLESVPDPLSRKVSRGNCCCAHGIPYPSVLHRRTSPGFKGYVTGPIERLVDSLASTTWLLFPVACPSFIAHDSWHLRESRRHSSQRQGAVLRELSATMSWDHTSSSFALAFLERWPRMAPSH